MLKIEKVFWQQRSRVSWLKEGDLITKFFHVKDTSRKIRNRLSGLFETVDGGRWKTREEDMEGIIKDIFQTFLQALVL